MTKVKSLVLLGAMLGIFELCFGEFFIASAPRTMQFLPSGDGLQIKRRELSGVINFMMGLPSTYLHRTNSWPGLKSIDVFNPPKANLLVTLHLPKGNEFMLKEFTAKYATDDLESRVSPVYELNAALVEEYQNTELVQQYVLPNQFKATSYDGVDINMIRDRLSGEDSILNGLPFALEFLTPKSGVDIRFFGELQMLHDVSEKLNVAKLNEKQSIHVILTSLDFLAQEYGQTSLQVKEAIKLLEFHIPQLIETAAKEFEGQLLCEVDVIPGPLPVSEYMVRHARSLLQSEPSPVSKESTNFTQLNLAEPNSENFAVVFNIVLWLMIGFFLAVLAVAYSMWFMDPGKDNIIYRVTSTRMKSD